MASRREEPNSWTDISVNMDQPIKSSGITKPTKMELQENLTDDYDYDVQESFNTYIWEELVPTLVVYILTLVIGVTGNFLIIFTIARYRRMKSITNVFLASLASADLLLILVCIPVKKIFSVNTCRSLKQQKEFNY
uniref:G_PROTEIN_RECEP_F1_2 domain-containing protein n=1 Tax=Rhodnius prolixus TaxID=13249 RepID=T1IDU0_RHOPR